MKTIFIFAADLNNIADAHNTTTTLILGPLGFLFRNSMPRGEAVH